MSWKKSFIASDENFVRLYEVRVDGERESNDGEKKSVNYYYFRRNLIDKSDCDAFSI